MKQMEKVILTALAALFALTVDAQGLKKVYNEDIK